MQEKGKLNSVHSRVDAKLVELLLAGGRLEVALPPCDQEPTSRTILNCRRLVPTFDHIERPKR